MKKRSVAAITPTAFANAGQFTSPPFSVALESAELRRRLLEQKMPAAGGKAPKAPAERRRRSPKE